MKPKVTVLTTVYNGERFIMETIKSVLNQTFEDFEYIIVDDGSTDNTANIIKSFKDKRIKYYYRGKNEGYFKLQRAINFGLKKAKGKYIARIDADDLCCPERLQIQFDFLESNQDIFLIGSSVNIIDKDGNIINTILKKEYPSMLLKLRIAISNPIIHSSIMFRNKGLEYPWHNEHFFYFNVLINGYQIKNMKEILTEYRINPNGLMKQYADLSKNKYKELYLE